MALLYLLEDDVAVDEHGVQWTSGDGGTWKRGSAELSPAPRLVSNNEHLALERETSLNRRGPTSVTQPASAASPVHGEGRQRACSARLEGEEVVVE
jgi:hypothetical protein